MSHPTTVGPEHNRDQPSSSLQAPSISLPRGGGAIRGMGEKFAANPVTGTGAMSVPLPTSAGRSGFGPSLALGYDSGAGNGPFGFGWGLSLPAITRKTDKGLPRYSDGHEDTFILSGAEDLVPVLEQDHVGRWRRVRHERSVAGREYTVERFRPRIEGVFARIERWIDRRTGVPGTPTGARSRPTTSPPATARPPRAGSPTRPTQPGCSAG